MVNSTSLPPNSPASGVGARMPLAVCRKSLESKCCISNILAGHLPHARPPCHYPTPSVRSRAMNSGSHTLTLRLDVKVPSASIPGGARRRHTCMHININLNFIPPGPKGGLAFRFGYKSLGSRASFLQQKISRVVDPKSLLGKTSCFS